MKHPGTRALTILLFLCVNLDAVAQQHVPSDITALSDEMMDHRIHFIEERLKARTRHAQTWFWSWLAINGGSTAGLGVMAGLVDKSSDRVLYISQATLAALGVGDLLLRPLEARYGCEPLRSLPAATRDEKRAKLRAAEDLLRSNANRAAEREDWLLHFANFVLNAAAGIATGLAGEATAGAINAGTGLLMGELYILTEPCGPKKDWEDYEAMVSGRTSGGIRLSLYPSPTGLTVRMSW